MTLMPRENAGIVSKIRPVIPVHGAGVDRKLGGVERLVRRTLGRSEEEEAT